ncbi:HAD-IA family hydrolase [Croceicoccus sp. Ery5]|uniref:HAD-IA family hydrolase n=1 Tax=Croceicoccus sp. Ery5 TaxID=1703340 RepID=UPI001E3CE9ED|nr:HAD-IA family hydrolase [Croceicoccus sp. Ery5]
MGAQAMSEPVRSLIRFDVIGFDLDGTLLDTAPDIAHALNHALMLAGRPARSVGEVRQMIGGGMKRLLATALGGEDSVPPDDLAALQQALLDHYRAHIAVETRAFDGMERALDTLAARGIALGVATNKLEGLAIDLLDRIGLKDRFAAIVGGDTLGADRAKPLPDMLHHLASLCGGKAMAFVGDSAFDVKAAKAARMPAIAVSFGYPGMPVDALGADRIIDHYDELLPALAAL